MSMPSEMIFRRRLYTAIPSLLWPSSQVTNHEILMKFLRKGIHLDCILIMFHRLFPFFGLLEVLSEPAYEKKKFSS